MNNIWEQTSEQANCQLCDNDKPYYINVERDDLVGLRLQIPWIDVINNGGGLPISGTLSIVDEIGTTTIANFGAIASNRFILGNRLDGTNYLAEYQIYTSIPMKDELGGQHVLYYIQVSSGDTVSFPSLGINFVYGIDSLPTELIEVKDGKLVRSGDPLNINILDVALVNGSPVTQSQLFSGTILNIAFENHDCFRYKFNITIAGVSKDYYTKPFRVNKCEDSVRMVGKYPLGTIDCNSYMHNSSSSLSNLIYPYMLIQRIPADVDRESNLIRKSYNDNCYNFKATKQKRYRLKSHPMPEWYVDEIEGLMMAQNFSINNSDYQIDNAENIFQVSDFLGQNYQNIDVPLSSCKCENVFVC